MAAAIGKRSIELIEEEQLAQNSMNLGNYFLNQLREISSPIITEVRGKGLWIGIEIDTKIISGRELCKRLLTKGILSKETHDSVIRFAPPLVITKKEIDWALEIFNQVISEIQAEQKN